MVIAEHPSAHAPDHGAVPTHEGRESGGFAMADEAIQQLPIRQPCSIREKDRAANVLDDLSHLVTRRKTGRSMLLSVLPHLY